MMHLSALSESRQFLFIPTELKLAGALQRNIGVRATPLRVRKHACLHKGFIDYNLDEIISFTVRDNTRSRRVMEKIGLTQDMDGDFQHPDLPKTHPLRWHVLYRLTKEQYMNDLKSADC